jgi:nicotinamidase-related amidase
MPVTTLDDSAALVVIDLQKGIAAFPVLRPLEEVIANVNLLARAFRKRNSPVIYVVAEGSSPGRTDAPVRHMERSGDFAELISTLDVDQNDYQITKYARSAFSGTKLSTILRDKGVTQVFIAGVATSNGVESTAREAFELGYNVVLATDAMTDANAEAEDYSLKRVFPRMAEIGETRNILDLF